MPAGLSCVQSGRRIHRLGSEVTLKLIGIGVLTVKMGGSAGARMRLERWMVL